MGVAYGALGLPLAFVSLPLYVALPHHYASNFGLSLGLLGLVLLLTRLLDAFIDPFIGQSLDRQFARGTSRVWAGMGWAAMGMATGLTALWWPPIGWVGAANGLVVWLVAALMLTYLCFSWTSIAHQAWGARWGGTAVQRAGWVAWREGAGLLGVILASVTPAVIGLTGAHGLMVVTLVLGWVGLSLTRKLPTTKADPQTALGGAIDAPVSTTKPAATSVWLPWQTPGFARLFLIFSLNGIASAVPATLLLFFVADVLKTPAWQPVFLASYFVAAALCVPLWVACVRYVGLRRTWLLGMALSIASFCATPLLGASDHWAFLAVCLASGCALGADLVVPGAMLAGLTAKAQGAERAESRFFAWWALAGKLNLALAAGISLPALAYFGYQAGTTDSTALLALSLAYGLVPCALKVLAFGALFGLKEPVPQSATA